MDVGLCIFTNCVNRDSPILETYKSFTETFGKLPLTIYCDPNPNPHKYTHYAKQLRKLGTVHKTTSLSDGYIKAIKQQKHDYLFMLEHDWEFINIHHTLEQIVQMMHEQGIYHFRFNKNPNTLGRKCKAKYMNERTASGITYVETDSLSNNPHIIHREFYLDYLLSKIKLRPSKYGIEEKLTNKGLTGCFYGGIDYPPTVKHLNGKDYVRPQVHTT